MKEKQQNHSRAACALPGILIVLAFIVSGCGRENSESNVVAPGAPPSTKTEILDRGAGVIQKHAPIAELNAYLDGFHFYNGRMEAQMEAHHYCATVNDEVIQCVIYDGNTKDAKIMGVEYIISQRLFAGLPASEKALWHSHAYEVSSGSLIAPGLPQPVEDELMKKLVSTYGKTWHTWHTDADRELPYGIPQLMMGFTADGQLKPDLLSKRDQQFGISSEEKKKHRAGIPVPPTDPQADAWQHSTPVQLDDPQHAHTHR